MSKLRPTKAEKTRKAEEDKKVKRALTKKRDLRKVLPKAANQYPDGWLERFDEYSVWQDRVNAVRLGPRVECRGCGKQRALMVPYYDGLCEECWCHVLWYCMQQLNVYYDQHPEEFFSEDRPDMLMSAVRMIDKAKDEGHLKALVSIAKEVR